MLLSLPSTEHLWLANDSSTFLRVLTLLGCSTFTSTKEESGCNLASSCFFVCCRLHFINVEQANLYFLANSFRSLFGSNDASIIRSFCSRVTFLLNHYIPRFFKSRNFIAFLPTLKSSLITISGLIKACNVWPKTT